jgi:hypothetical protein
VNTKMERICGSDVLEKKGKMTKVDL